MELDFVEGGFIEYEVMTSMTREDVKRLRNAMALCIAHLGESIDYEIFEDFLEVSEGL
jgi:hypothetical protein